jgi:hypothetical protein
MENDIHKVNYLTKRQIYQRRYYEKNKEILKEKRKIYYEKNKYDIIQKQKKYQHHYYLGKRKSILGYEIYDNHPKNKPVSNTVEF